MSRSQTKGDGFAWMRRLGERVDSLERLVNKTGLRDVNTTGMSSAQIDFSVFGGQQPYDGAQIIDKANTLLLVRESGQWCSTTLTPIA